MHFSFKFCSDLLTETVSQRFVTEFNLILKIFRTGNHLFALAQLENTTEEDSNIEKRWRGLLKNYIQTSRPDALQSLKMRLMPVVYSFDEFKNSYELISHLREMANEFYEIDLKIN